MTTVVHHPPSTRVPVLLAGLTVLLEIAYPLVHGVARDRLTVLTVCCLFATSTVHAVVTRGPRFAAAVVLVAGGTGLLAEALGTATGVPFGDYTYADSLGPKLLDVPVVIPLAWAMFAYPCLLVGRRLARTWRVPLVAGGALASWDLFLDPQMVEAGHWRWLDIQQELPGISGIPVSNFFGWALVGVLMMAVLHRLAPDRGPVDDRVPAALFLWTYASSVLANAVFFGRPGVALVGGLVMGMFAIPYARDLARR